MSALCRLTNLQVSMDSARFLWQNKCSEIPKTAYCQVELHPHASCIQPACCTVCICHRKSARALQALTLRGCSFAVEAVQLARLAPLLTALTLTHCDEQTSTAMVHSVTVLTQLRQMHLWDVHLNDRGRPVSRNVCHRMYRAYEIQICFTWFFPLGIRRIAGGCTGLRRIGQVCTALVDLEIRHCPGLQGDGLAALALLTRLDLRDSRLENVTVAAALMHLTRLEDLSASVFNLSSGVPPTLSCHFIVSWSNCACRDGLHACGWRSQSLYVHRSPLKLVSVPSCRPLRRSGAGVPHQSAACVRQCGDGQRSGSRVGGGPTGSGLDGGTWRLATPDIPRPLWLSRGGTRPGCHIYASSISCNAHWQPSSDGPDALEHGHYLVCWGCTYGRGCITASCKCISLNERIAFRTHSLYKAPGHQTSVAWAAQPAVRTGYGRAL